MTGVEFTRGEAHEIEHGADDDGRNDDWDDDGHGLRLAPAFAVRVRIRICRSGQGRPARRRFLPRLQCWEGRWRGGDEEAAVGGQGIRCMELIDGRPLGRSVDREAGEWGALHWDEEGEAGQNGVRKEWLRTRGAHVELGGVVPGSDKSGKRREVTNDSER